MMGLEQTGVKYLNVCSTPPQNIKASALIGKCSHFDAVFQKNINPVMFLMLFFKEILIVCK